MVEESRNIQVVYIVVHFVGFNTFGTTHTHTHKHTHTHTHTQMQTCTQIETRNKEETQIMHTCTKKHTIGTHVLKNTLPTTLTRVAHAYTLLGRAENTRTCMRSPPNITSPPS